MPRPLSEHPASARPLLNFEETTDLLRSSRSSVHRMVKRGDLTPVKLGGRTLFRRIDLDALIERCLGASN